MHAKVEASHLFEICPKNSGIIKSNMVSLDLHNLTKYLWLKYKLHFQGDIKYLELSCIAVTHLKALHYIRI
jgi:hypothetical protein